MVFCGKCGSKNPNEASFCWKCGSELLHEDSGGTPVGEGVSENNHDSFHNPQHKNKNYERSEQSWADKGPNAEAERIYVDGDDPFTQFSTRPDGKFAIYYRGRVITPEDCNPYRVPAIVVGVVAAVIMLYLLFGYEIGVSLGLNTENYRESMTFYEIAKEGFQVYNYPDIPVDLLFWLAVLCVAVGVFLPFVTIFACVLWMVSMGVCHYCTVAILWDMADLNLTLNTIPGAMLVFIPMVTVCIAEWLASRYALQFVNKNGRAPSWVVWIGHR